MGLILLLLLNCITDADLENIIYVSGKKPADAFVIGKPTKKADWETVPKVRVCASTQLIMSRVDTAVKYWEKLGGFSAHHMAATRLYTSTRSGKIVMAKIFILPKNGRKERVLEHEIGHALGWSHYSQKTHIMHPDWQYGGYDSKGLSK